MIPRRGVTGVESAIVLIAFVIVAAAIAYVVLNSGFQTTEKAKSAITSGLSEASSGIEVAGAATGKGNVTNAVVAAYTIPAKLAAGGSSIDIAPDKMIIRYSSKAVSYDNIYSGIMSNTTFASMDDAIQQAKDENMIVRKPGEGAGPANTAAIVYFTTNTNNNKVLDPAEQIMILVVFKDAERPAALDVARLEVIPASGAPLSVERTIPPVADAVIRLD
ncbi:archaeal flagellin-like protein [Candidatus Nitrososphaera evergladensis SR1]|uniref:Flagellin n=1 Tax=Candidatus Nitrososphaera evergladensis SR1 TaxID=1459636 RepID=A0A075MS76_9ARCH|nr:archaellin/type IV pilin N-terminal domain-containing protein [Candidatus Nitrososphaera evergladensis]AIF84406.1 archaeal flagellin-like protein [Candidatus Nitrososphaera evergladensis SR1]